MFQLIPTIPILHLNPIHKIVFLRSFKLVIKIVRGNVLIAVLLSPLAIPTG